MSDPDRAFHHPSRTPRRLVVLVCALFAVLVPTRAWALAPMCDEHAQTIEAPAPIYPSDNGVISAKMACNDGPHSELGSAPSRDPGRPQLTADSIDRGLAAQNPIPPCARSERLALASSELGRARAGNQSDVFRPPQL